MRQRSRMSEMRRRWASTRRCCARSAMVLLLATVMSQLVAGEDIPASSSLPTPPPPTGNGSSLQPPAIPEEANLPAPDTAHLSSPNKSLGGSQDLEQALVTPGTLNFHDLSLNAALFMIGEQWNINIVAGEVEGKVNGVFKEAPLREVLDSILLSNGYNYRVVGKSLVVSKTEELGQINPFFQSTTIPVHTADIDEVVEGAKLLSTPQGQVRPLKSARAIIVLDFPDRVKMIRQFVAAIDGATEAGVSSPYTRTSRPLEVAYFSTQHIPARAAEQALQAVLSPDGRVGVLEKSDRLIVTDHEQNLVMIEKVLQRVDQPVPQVRIHAYIYDISLQDLEDIGLKWNKIGYRSTENSGIGIAGATSPFDTLELVDGSLTGAVAGTGNIAVGTLSEHFDISAVLNLLQKAQDARLLGEPSVAVLQNEEAVFKSVREIPIQQLTETAQGGNIGTTAFREAGVKLTVTPKIACDETILMHVLPEFSRLVGFDDNGQPIIDTREAATVLRIANRQTVVIGGLRQRDDAGEFSGIPYLKDVKYVGRLFRARSKIVRESELVVFIQPEIIDCADTPNYRQRMAETTVRCRLNQIPEAEGCPPSCRRLPPEMIVPTGPVWATPTEVPLEEMPANEAELPPHSATDITPAELQFGPAGRNAEVRGMVADGRLRRLPTIEAAAVGQGDAYVADGQPASIRR